jgi:benzoyl-CoA reductase/2-hydroxyglutaryl-CoA dehydratase subunit BcrC/BadD/HgdB
MRDQQPQHTKEELAELIEKQRKQRELIAEFNAKFSRPGAWTIGKELGELHIGVGIVNAVSEQPPRANEGEGKQL